MTAGTPEAVLGALRDGWFADRATAWEQAGAVPREDVERLAGHGLLGMTIGTAHHGSDLPLVDVTEVHRLVAAASPSLHSLLVVHTMVCHALHRWAVGETRDALLPELAAGRVLAAFALTETSGGADAGALATTIDRDGDTLRVTGEKRWLSFGRIADAYLVFGRTGGLDSCALVDAGSAVRVDPEPLTAGLRAAQLARVTFDGATAPAARAVGRPGTGIPFVATSCLTLGRLCVAAGAVGIARAALDLAVGHVATRTTGGRRLGDHQLVRGLLADAALATESAAHYVRSAAREVEDRAPTAAVTAAGAKLLASRAAGSATAAASRLLGAEGQTEDHPLARLVTAARVHEVIEGPTEVLQDVVAAALLRDPGAPKDAGHPRAGARRLGGLPQRPAATEAAPGSPRPRTPAHGWGDPSRKVEQR
ncbi:acyl-CoA dehydrogenase [Streptomyces pilosus]|uniref:acyl-CoA dehydrogenase family protein n=1 Tax=Streptomyces pilosus TaxID=28893 RepID=UPI00167616F7|nr:acyl-CoA dehydrogenase family protein [Streptomyces pilosus]GGV66905.1 acyl-CoA dehydrogenase [Streptomyces pilosus]